MIQNKSAFCYIDSSKKTTILAILNDQEIILYCLGSQNIPSEDSTEILRYARILSRWSVGNIPSETPQALAISCITTSNQIVISVAYKSNEDLLCQMFSYDSNLLEKEIYSRITFVFKVKNSVVKDICNINFLNDNKILFVVNGDTLMISDSFCYAYDNNEMNSRKDNSNNQSGKNKFDDSKKDKNNGIQLSDHITHTEIRKEIYCHKLPPLMGFNKAYNLLQTDSTVIRDILIINQNDGDIAMIIKSK